MNNHAKRLCTHLEVLDFRRDYDAEQKTNARRVYRHANDLAQAIKVFDCMNDSTITIARKLADKIVGLGASGNVKPASIKERANIQRRKQKTQREREDEARRERAEAAEREHLLREREAEADRRRSEIERLMQPGHGR